MRKFLLAIAFALPLMAQAKGDDTKYLAGAVPEVNGIVTFQKSFTVPGMPQDKVSSVLRGYMSKLVEESIPAPTNYARFVQDSKDTLVIRACEWLVFKKKPLYLDRTRMRYQFNATVDQQNHVQLTITAISYYYDEDNEGEKGQTIRAEEWISDKEALNKSQTKLYPKSGKFRRFTVDRAEEIFEGAMDAFEAPKEPEAEQPKKKVRSYLIEN